ncbi:MAG: tetratricopeptide repeat protein [Deltaproteobacteria bacterium]|jgi:tetratricopeptide (TPR) repeat protein|nr:tetratricopeptide repeat protein [Deltaproteobacteria bacterium]
MKIWSRLSARDLPRFRDGLAADLGELFPGLVFEAGPEAAESAWLTVPLVFRGRALGTLSVTPGDGAEPPSAETAAVIPRAARALLQKAALRKALLLDRESGLRNRDSFLARMARLMPPLEQGPRSLSPDGGGRGGLALGLIEIQEDWGPEARALASRLSGLPGLAALGRISESLLGVVLRAGPEEALARLDASLAPKGGPAAPGGRRPEGERDGAGRRPGSPSLFGNLGSLGGPSLAGGARNAPRASLACFPDDLSPEDLNPAREPAPSLALLEKARTALAFARARDGSGPRRVTAFRDITARLGRITQVLPQERVMIDLGRSVGCRAGQVYTALDGEGAPKGEVAVFETGPGYGLARILAGPGAGRPSEGDRLEFARTEEPDAGYPHRDPGSAAAREGFLSGLAGLAAGGAPFLLAIARLDDFEKLAGALGEGGAEARLQAFAEALGAILPSPPSLSGPWEPGARGFAWTGAAAEAGSAAALAAFLGGREGTGGVSLALVFWPQSPPEVLPPEGLAQAAAATLLEAAMTGEAAAAVFGPQTLNILGDRLFDEGDLEGAAREYRRGLRLDPGHLNLRNSLGVCHGRLGDQKAAAAAFDEVLRRDPDNLMAAFNKGCSYILGGRPEEAEGCLEKAAALDPSNFEVLYQLGKTSLELGHAAKAARTLSAAAALKTRRGAVFSLLGQARSLSGDSQGAMAAFKQAVKFNPDDAASLSSLGALYREVCRDNAIALSLMRRSVELDPSNVLFRHRLGKLLYDMGRFAEAERHLRSALEYSSRGLPPAAGDGLGALAAELERCSEDAAGGGEPAPGGGEAAHGGGEAAHGARGGKGADRGAAPAAPGRLVTC